MCTFKTKLGLNNKMHQWEYLRVEKMGHLSFGETLYSEQIAIGRVDPGMINTMITFNSYLSTVINSCNQM